MNDAARSDLEGDVSPQTTGGVIRYRVWPARRRPLRLALALGLVIGLTVLAAKLIDHDPGFWALTVGVALCVVAAPFFFPTTVGLDGFNLNIRQFGIPRVYNLREYKRLEVNREVVARVELLQRARMSPMDKLKGLVVPLPADGLIADAVVVHLRKWVGRRPTGRFSLDIDHVPEDGGNAGD